MPTTPRSAPTGVFAVTTSKRRRLLWCAWWKTGPTRDPFQPPDAWSGGARDEAEARAQAERAADQPLREIEGAWAGAWVRTMAGLPPWILREDRPRPAQPTDGPNAFLGVRVGASLAEIKRAFRAQALLHHPDKGGATAHFVRLKHAYESLVAKAEKASAASSTAPRGARAKRAAAKAKRPAR